MCILGFSDQGDCLTDRSPFKSEHLANFNELDRISEEQGGFPLEVTLFRKVPIGESSRLSHSSPAPAATAAAAPTTIAIL